MKLRRRLLRNKMDGAVTRGRETWNGRVISVDSTTATCLVDVFGGTSSLVKARIPARMASYAKAGSTVRLSRVGAAMRTMEISGAGATLPADPQTPSYGLPDIIMNGIGVRAFDNPVRADWVWVHMGTYRMDGVVTDLEAMTMGAADTAGVDMSWGLMVGQVAGVLDLSPALVTGTRFDLVVIDENGDLDTVTGTPVAAGVEPTVPDTPTGSILVNKVQRKGGIDEIPQEDIGLAWATQVLTELTVTIADETMAWALASTTITVALIDQNDAPIFGVGFGNAVKVEITDGNGTLFADGSGESTTSLFVYTGTGSSVSVTYTRGQVAGDESPTFAISVIGSTVTADAEIELLDAGGSPM